jgi:hypothetical protein
VASLVNLQDEVLKAIIKYSKEFNEEDDGVKKVEHILTGSRLLFLFEDTRFNLYAVQTQNISWGIKQNIAHLNKLKHNVREDSGAGKPHNIEKGKFYTLQTMEDVRVKFSMNQTSSDRFSLKEIIRQSHEGHRFDSDQSDHFEEKRAYYGPGEVAWFEFDGNYRVSWRRCAPGCRNSFENVPI